MNSSEAHDKGQTDASEGNYDRPHSATEELFSFGEHLEHVHDNNQHYDQGHNHTESQKK